MANLSFLIGPAKGAAVLVLVQHLLGSVIPSGVPEEIIRVEGGVAEKFKRASMEIVGARLSDDIYVGARIAAISGITGRGLNLEFLNGIWIGNRERPVSCSCSANCRRQRRLGDRCSRLSQNHSPR